MEGEERQEGQFEQGNDLVRPVEPFAGIPALAEFKSEGDPQAFKQLFERLLTVTLNVQGVTSHDVVPIALGFAASAPVVPSFRRQMLSYKRPAIALLGPTDETKTVADLAISLYAKPRGPLHLSPDIGMFRLGRLAQGMKGLPILVEGFPNDAIATKGEISDWLEAIVRSHYPVARDPLTGEQRGGYLEPVGITLFESECWPPDSMDLERHDVLFFDVFAENESLLSEMKRVAGTTYGVVGRLLEAAYARRLHDYNAIFGAALSRYYDKSYANTLAFILVGWQALGDALGIAIPFQALRERLEQNVGWYPER